MKKKICIVLCLGCIGTVSVVGCSNKNFDSKVTGDNQTTIGMISGILIIAVLVAGITIMKKRPKQILSEMS